MAQYILLIRGDDESELPEPEARRIVEQYVAWLQGMRAKGHQASGNELAPGGKLVRGASRTVIDGPFAETRELVGGYILVSARDLDEAVELAKGCPSLERGFTVEVRPVIER